MNEVVDIVKVADPLHVGVGVPGQLVELSVDHDVVDYWEGDEADEEDGEDGLQVPHLEVVDVCIYRVLYLLNEQRVL